MQKEVVVRNGKRVGMVLIRLLLAIEGNQNGCYEPNDLVTDRKIVLNNLNVNTHVCVKTYDDNLNLQT